MQATTMLPMNFRQLATLDLSNSKKAIAASILLGTVLLVAFGWLLVQYTQFIRPAALEGIGFREILAITPDGQSSITIPIVDAAVAFVMVIFIHELVHGIIFWWFSGKRPKFGVKGLFVYTAAPPEVYLPRNQYIVVGLTPLVLLTLAGLLLIVIVPVVAVSILSFFTAFNAAGAGGDLVMAGQLLSFSPDTLIQDSDTGAIVYGPKNN